VAVAKRWLCLMSPRYTSGLGNSQDNFIRATLSVLFTLFTLVLFSLSSLSSLVFFFVRRRSGVSLDGSVVLQRSFATLTLRHSLDGALANDSYLTDSNFGRSCTCQLTHHTRTHSQATLVRGAT
jgi:hypothetical protein